jgi:hypothetical protein
MEGTWEAEKFTGQLQRVFYESSGNIYEGEMVEGKKQG